jgi:hypothetical protein
MGRGHDFKARSKCVFASELISPITAASAMLNH